MIMRLERLATMTGFMRHGMTLRDFFQETVRCKVPGLPFVDVQDQIIGRISLRDVYKTIAVPDNILRIADAMSDGEQMNKLGLQEIKILELMDTPVENYLLEKIPSVSPSSAVVKALALMEVHNSSYIFLIENGKYEGVVTRMIIAERMLECVLDMERKRNAAQ
jgi:predicted transcriptional regulator